MIDFKKSIHETFSQLAVATAERDILLKVMKEVAKEATAGRKLSADLALTVQATVNIVEKNNK